MEEENITKKRRKTNNSQIHLLWSECTYRHVKHNKDTSIDDIPRDLICKVVSYLPILEAGRASILSTSWRNQWTKLPDIIFNDSTISEPMRANIISIVNTVLSQHLGPIDRFEYHNLPVMGPNLNEWFLQLCRKNVKFLKCSFQDEDTWYNNEPCILPSVFFSCIQLVHAELHYFQMKVPVPCNSFGCLLYLHLEDIIISGDELQHLIARCPLLQKLVLKHLVTCTRLKFSSPYLHELEIDGPFDEVYFENTAHLAVFSITNSGEFYNKDEMDPYNLIKSLAGMLELESLKFGAGVIEFLIFGHGVRGLPNFLQLKRMHIVDINLQSEFDMEFLCYLLQSCPSLEELIIDADSFRFEEDADSQSLCYGDGWDSLRFNNLKYFFYSDNTSACELVLISRVFDNAPVLQRFELGIDLMEAVIHGIYEHIDRLPKPDTLTEINYDFIP